MDCFKFIFFVGTFVTSFGITENSELLDNHVDTPLCTSTKARNERFVEFSHTGPDQWLVNVKLPPSLKNWMNSRQYTPFVRAIKKQLINGIRIGRKEIKGYGNDTSWTIKSYPIDSRITHRVPTVLETERNSKIDSPLCTSNKARYKSFVEFSQTGLDQWKAHVNLPPFLKNWMNRPQYASYVRDITHHLKNGIRISRKEIKGHGNDKSWTIESRPIDTRIAQDPTPNERARESKEEKTTTPAAKLTETTDLDDNTLDDDDGGDGDDPEKWKVCKYGTKKNPYPPLEINKAERRVSDIKCEEHMHHLKYKIIDGTSNEIACDQLKGNSLVVGAINSEEGDFPHMGAVGWLNDSKNNSWVYMCGTSLISSRFSITAGHCAYNPSSIHLYDRGPFAKITDLQPKVVRFGNVDITDDEDVIIMKIEQFIVTEEYSEHLHWKYNDIGLIKFTTDVPISQYVRPACLWDGYLRGHLTGNVTGWGQTRSDIPESKSNHLLYAEIDFFSKGKCIKMLENRTNRLWKKGLIDSQFCAGKLKGNVDTCQGDSGGPIQVQEPLRMQSNVPMYYVVGIISFGCGHCGQPNIPAVYTNVTQYLCWIEKTVWPDEENQQCNGS